METTKTISSIGYITKEESLRSYKSQQTHKQLILEGCDTYPGYYDLFERPRTKQELLQTSFLYIVLKTNLKLCEDETIRVTQKIKKRNTNFTFDAVLGTIYLFNKIKTVLRLKLNSVELLTEIISAYESYGLEFDKYRDIKEYTSIINLRKFIMMEEVEENIYQDANEKEVYYISINKQFDWNNFKEITKIIKTNCNYKNFDAALANIYCKDGIMDFIRIWDNEDNPEKIKEIKKLYYRKQ